MRALDTAIIYALIGLSVAAAQQLKLEQSTGWQRVGSFLLAALFWPLFAPLLLAGKSSTPLPPTASPTLDRRMATIQANLLATLDRLKGVAEEVLAPEAARVRGLSSSVAAMEQRLTEMDKLLAAPEFNRAAAEAALKGLLDRALDESDPRVQSVRARLRNIDRLQAMRARTVENLERIVLKLEEMSSQLQLLEFAGRPDAEVVGMIKDIAETVEGVAEGLLSTESPPATVS